MPTEDTALAKTDESPLPMFRGKQMIEALTAYRELQKALDVSMPEQVMELDGRPFRKKGYWRAIAVAFGLTVEPITSANEERSVVGTLEDGSENYVYLVTYRAAAKNGRSAIGDGTCAASEKQKGRMDATEHNVRSHAHTRAFNRAVSNLVGFGEVSAEEVDRYEHRTESGIAPSEREQSTTPADGQLYVTNVERKTGTNKETRKPWTKFNITVSDKRSGSTFDAEMAVDAEGFEKAHTPVEVAFEKTGKFTNILKCCAADIQVHEPAVSVPSGQPTDPAGSPLSMATPTPGTFDANTKREEKPKAPSTVECVYAVTRVVEIKTGDKTTYGIETKELGVEVYLTTPDIIIAKSALRAKIDGNRIGVQAAPGLRTTAGKDSYILENMRIMKQKEAEHPLPMETDLL